MTRYFIKLSYKGTHFHGWQIQPNAITVQEMLQQALSTLLKTYVEVIGCGRTDTGVHAQCFYAHFDFATKIADTALLTHQLNAILSKDIAIKNIIEVPLDMHARFDATSRTYIYKIISEKCPFEKDFAYYNPYPFNVDAMNRACAFLFHHTDFTSFSKLHTDVKTNNCKITEAHWQHSAPYLIFTITADRFLRNMVRAIVGTMLDIGRQKLQPSDIEAIILKKDRKASGVSVPACGLYLKMVAYEDR